MRLLLRLCAVLFLFCVSLTGGSTKLTSTFRNPKAGPADLSGKKIACFVIIPSEELRSAREESVAEEMRSRGLDSIAGSFIVPGELVRDRDKAIQFLEKSGISLAVLVRLLGDEEAKKYSTTTTAWYSQPYYGSFSGYWNHGWSTAYISETVWTERVVTLEILIYSIRDNGLIWAGRGETSSPGDIKKFVKELAEAAGKELRKQGLVLK